MKRNIAILVGLLASLAVVSASAQDHAAKATVPFGFYVGNTWMPAGTYRMTSQAESPNIISIRNAQTNESLLSLTQLSDKQPGANRLEFKKYGDRYFLHQILSSSGMNVQFAPSRKERLAETREANVAPPSTVYLALR